MRTIVRRMTPDDTTRRAISNRRTLPCVSAFPVTRRRRFRPTASLRGLVRETDLRLDQFVMPFFVAPEPLANEALPGMARFDIDGLVREVDALASSGVRAVMLF